MLIKKYIPRIHHVYKLEYSKIQSAGQQCEIKNKHLVTQRARGNNVNNLEKTPFMQQHFPLRFMTKKFKIFFALVTLI
jgi:hypothetical protein